MIGLDGNVILRYLLQDDQKQTRQANQIVDRQLSKQNLGFISLVTALEILWVLRNLLKQNPFQIALISKIF
jgi:predicted nucleic-acid-binding protein